MVSSVFKWLVRSELTSLVIFKEIWTCHTSRLNATPYSDFLGMQQFFNNYLSMFAAPGIAILLIGVATKRKIVSSLRKIQYEKLSAKGCCLNNRLGDFLGIAWSTGIRSSIKLNFVRIEMQI